ncbi:MAG: glycosyltransferase family 4 protein [Cyclobacteriaceae bacterium]|nr:glycosyltransferase family 4 protein [Cyclobacteriaceae bacterium]
MQVIDQLNVGGAERVLVDLANILHRQGESVTVITLVRPGKLAAQLNPEIPLLNLGRVNRFNVLKMFRINRICSRYDIVHVHLRYNFRYVALAKLFFGGRYKLLLHDHFGDIENDKAIPTGIKFFLHRNPWFAGVSQPLVDWAVQYIGLEKENVFLLANIIVRKETTLTKRAAPSVPKLLLVSNFREAKNHAFACRLLSRLRNTLNFTATFVGQVIDPQFMDGIHKQIRGQKLDDIVKVVHDCDDVQGIMGEYNLAIHTAYQESGPLVLIEYLAQQLPFVAYKTGEVATQLQAVIPDFFMENFEIEHWIDRIETLLSRGDHYKDSMKDAFDAMYSDQAYVEKCSGIYSRMMINGH